MGISLVIITSLELSYKIEKGLERDNDYTCGRKFLYSRTLRSGLC